MTCNQTLLDVLDGTLDIATMSNEDLVKFYTCLGEKEKDLLKIWLLAEILAK